MKTVVLALLRFYKRWISPSLLPSCRYVPSCSEYASEAVDRYGVIRGGAMAAWRLLRCQPFAKGGYDPVVKGNVGTGICPVRTGPSPAPTHALKPNDHRLTTIDDLLTTGSQLG
jgi:uncharacterized protein